MKSKVRPVNILVVDDDEVDIMAVKRTLSRARTGNAIWVAGDGIEALDLLRGSEIPRPRIILLDLNMPRMNGIAFLQELRQDPNLSEESVIVMTTSSAKEDRSAAVALGVQKYLVKEKVHDELIELVRRPDE